MLYCNITNVVYFNNMQTTVTLFIQSHNNFCVIAGPTVAAGWPANVLVSWSVGGYVPNILVLKIALMPKPPKARMLKFLHYVQIF